MYILCVWLWPPYTLTLYRGWTTGPDGWPVAASWTSIYTSPSVSAFFCRVNVFSVYALRLWLAPCVNAIMLLQICNRLYYIVRLHDRLHYVCQFAPGMSAKYFDECLLYVCSHISETTRAELHQFLCMLTVAVAGSSPGGVTIRHVVLPVLRMMSCSHIVGFTARRVHS